MPEPITTTIAFGAWLSWVGICAVGAGIATYWNKNKPPERIYNYDIDGPLGSGIH